MKARPVILLCFLLLLALWLRPGELTVQAGTVRQADEPPHPRRVYGPLELTKPSAPVSGLAVYEPQAGSLPWTALVFQLYTASGWNIAFQPRDDTQVYLLTDDAASDITPRLSPDGTIVAFASKTDKNFRIVVLDLVNGARQTLTEQLGDAVSPFWSPDGSRIAFEWERDGNSDIWVMNADGSGLTRLTDDGDYDGMPAWSPDGLRLAFISRRTGGYRLYVMNADGSNQLMYSNLPYSGDPAWSPDGKTIAFDADSDQDEWLELWKIGADMVGQALIAKPAQYTGTDYLMGSWSPDGTEVAYSYVNWISLPQGWYIDTAYIKSMIVTNQITANLVPYDTAMNPDWRSMDRLAPTSQVLPLTRFARPGQIVTWLGSDSGGSGVYHYDIQTRDQAGGNWIGWISGTTYANAALNQAGGHTYEFRSRAQDHALNLENWPAAADASVTIYNWMIQGQVHNNRGAPVVYPTVTTSGNPFANLNDVTSGSYQIYAGQAAPSYTATWQKNSYGSLPQTSFPGYVDARFNPVLPPADNRVVNGNFETSGLAPGWNIAGDHLPVQSNRAAFSGSKGAWIGEDDFLPFNDTADAWPYDNNDLASANIGLDAQNRIHLAWANGSGLMYGGKADGAWALGPMAIPNTANNVGDSLKMQVAPDGVVHFTWSQDERIYYQRYDHGTWGARETVSDPNYSAGGAVLSLEANGLLHMVYRRPDSVYYARRTGTNQWSREYVGDCGIQLDLYLMQDPSGVVHVVCTMPYGIGTMWRTLDGHWLGNQEFPVLNAMDWAFTPDGVVHAIGVGSSSTLAYTYRRPNEPWSQFENVITAQSGGLNSAYLAMGPDGQPRVLVSIPGDNVNYQYLRRISENTWSTPQIVTGLDYSKKFHYEVSQDGVDHLFVSSPFASWQHVPNGDWSITQEIADASYHLLNVVRDARQRPFIFGFGGDKFQLIEPPLAELSGSSRLTQTITIPADMPSPTLSYQLDYTGAPSAANSAFSLILDDSTTHTELIRQSDSTTGWTHHWHDLSAWAGQTITLTFQVDSAAGIYQTYARLDDVSLGAAYPSLWVRGSGNPYAQPGKQFNFAIQWGAYSGPLAPNAVLTADLQAGWSFLSANPAPQVTNSQLIWQLGDLASGTKPQTIQLNLECKIGVPLFSDLSIPLGIHSDLSELDLEDNQAVIPVMAAYPAFLPYVQR